MSTKEITVLMVEPGQHPKVTTLKDNLDTLQKAVSIGADYQDSLNSSAWVTAIALCATRKVN